MAKHTSSYKPHWFLRFRRILLRLFFKVLFHLLFNVKFQGMENIPADGAYIIAYNHVAYFEPPFILTFWPTYPEALAGADVFERRAQGAIVKAYGAMPVKRGEYDRSILEKMRKVLSSGFSILISPEGGRSHKPGLRRAYKGVAYMIDQVQVPVVPVAITGMRDDSLTMAVKGRRDTFIMEVGKPFMLPKITGKGIDRREMRQENADQVMREIGKMLPPEYHGVYAGQIDIKK
ncbi:MAG: 1-acyl-sn-glycerol-3-phosphate acyltransferase [Chloroflexota bacterium]